MSPSAATLPLVRTLQGTGDFFGTVLPYLPQLGQLPGKILESASNPADLKQLYLETNPLITALAFALFLAPVFVLVAEVNKNYSQVDRCWSILPTVYIGHYVTWAHMTGMQTKRLDHIMAISAVWSLRLTFNYWRKGGYSIGSEDYRWEVLRKSMSPALFFVFNVGFIALAQSILLFLITTPLYVFILASGLGPDTMSVPDTFFSRLMMCMILAEFFADQQQWNFHQAKLSYRNTAKVPPNWEREELDRGFLVSGLWSWSRHPNFAAEQGVWLTLYQWSCYETMSYLNWTIVGALGYVFLFQASTNFTEKISGEKYPEYAQYQKLVSKFLPRLSTLLPGGLPEPVNTQVPQTVNKEPQTKKAEPQSKTGKAAGKSKH